MAAPKKRTTLFRPFAVGLLFIAILVFVSGFARAQIFKADNSDALDLGTSWVGGNAPGSGDIATWDATVATPANCTNALGGAVAWAGINVSNPAVAVKILTNGLSSGTGISLGSSGITLTNTADLWLAPALAATVDQSWTTGSGRTLTFGEAGRVVTVNNGANVTLNGTVALLGQIRIPGTLTISSGSFVGTNSTNSEECDVGTSSGVGAVNQSGGTVALNTIGSSGSPKASMIIGNGGAGTYTITGGSLLDNSASSGGRFDIGSSASGTLNVNGTASVQCEALYVANGSGNGVINMTNGTLTIPSGVNCRIGVSGPGIGMLNVYGGLVQSASTMNVPNGAGTGVLNVNGGIANLTGLNVANSGPGTIAVNGGTLNVTNNIALAPSTGDGTLNLNGGFTFASAITHAGTGTGALNWNGGVLKTRTSSLAFIAGNIVIGVGTNGAMMDTTNLNIAFLSPLLNGTSGSGDGGFNKLGSGTLTLSGTNTFTGPTIVSAGTLIVTNGGSIAASTNLSVAIGATLDIAGSGTLAIQSSPTLDGTLVMQVSKSGTTLASDQLAFTNGTINYGGALTIIASGAALNAGDTFELFNAASIKGAFSTINLPALASNLFWDTTSLNVNGTIKVSGSNSAPVLPPVVNTVTVQNGTNLFIAGSGGTTNGAFYVLSATNLALPLMNWTMIGGSNLFDAAGNFAFTNAIVPSRPAQFFVLSSGPAVLSPSDAILLQALQNMRDDGFNTYLPAPGGLWVNWIYTNTPPVNQSMGNINYDGTPDPSPTTRHDRLTDIEYLAALSLYKELHPLDTQFDAEINRYTNICESPLDDNFPGSPDERGWVYWAIADVASLVPNFSTVKNAQADAYYNLYSSHLGQYGQVMPLYYSTPTNELDSIYRGDVLVEDGCVLIVNGRERNLANYITAGENLIAYAQSNDYSSTLQLWADTMGNLFTDTNHTAISPPSRQYIYNDTLNTSEVGEITEALCRAEAADPGKGFGPLALATLNKLAPATNSFGLWDTTHGGYYSNLILNGTNIQSAGLTAGVDSSYKQVGRAAVMAQSYLAAMSFAGADYGTNILGQINQATLNSYYATGHGWPFQENDDYSIYLDHVGSEYIPQIWVTSESISHAARAILKYRLGSD